MCLTKRGDIEPSLKGKRTIWEAVFHFSIDICSYILVACGVILIRLIQAGAEVTIEICNYRTGDVCLNGHKAKSSIVSTKHLVWLMQQFYLQKNPLQINAS